MTRQKHDTQDEKESQVSEDRDGPRAITAGGADSPDECVGSRSGCLHWCGAL